MGENGNCAENSIDFFYILLLVLRHEEFEKSHDRNGVRLYTLVN